MRAISGFVVNLIPNDTLSALPHLKHVLLRMASLCFLPNISSPESSFLFPLSSLLSASLNCRGGRGKVGGRERERQREVSEKVQAVVTYQGFLSKIKVSKYTRQKWKMVL